MTTRTERERWLRDVRYAKNAICYECAWGDKYAAAVPALCEHVERLEGLLREAVRDLPHTKTFWTGPCVPDCFRCRIEQELQS